MTGDARRLLDALARHYDEDAGADVERILVVASLQTAPLVRGLLALFPGAGVVVVVHAEDKFAELRAALADEDAKIQLVRGGVVDLPDLAPGPYDLAVVRHPDISIARAAWELAFAAVAAELTRDGVLVLSAGLLPDAGFIHENMEALSLAMLPGTPYTAVPVAFSGVDRYIMLYGPV